MGQRPVIDEVGTDLLEADTSNVICQYLTPYVEY